MGIKDHGQGFSAALSVPEHAALTVRHGGVSGGFDGFLHGEILVVRRHHLEGVLPIHIKADKVFQNVQKARLFKHPLKEGVELGVLGILIAAVPGLPLHEAVLAGGDGARPGGGQIAHDADLVVDKQGGDLIHIVAQLPVGCGCVCLLPGRRFQFHHHQGQAVNEQHYIRALLRVLHDGPLVDNGKIIVGGVAEVDEIDQSGTFFPVYKVFDGHAGLHIVREGHVFLEQGAGLEVFYHVDSLIQRLHGEPRVDAL